MTLYGPSFYQVMIARSGDEIDSVFEDIRVVRNGDRIGFAEDTLVAADTITITCLEKGDGDVSGKLLVLPYTLEELKHVGVKVYGAHYSRVLDDKGVEINDIRLLRNGDRIVYARHNLNLGDESSARAMIMLTITCLENGDSVGRLMVLPSVIDLVRRVGKKLYGAHFVRVLNEQGDEMDNIKKFRDGDRIDFAARKLNAWITITITKMGDFKGKLVVLPGSLMELVMIGVKVYGAIFVHVMNEKGDKIDGIRELRNGDRVIFASEKWDVWSNVQKRVVELNALKRAEELHAQKLVEESNAQKRIEELNAQKWVEESNAHVTITCLTPIMRVLRELW